jgi:hypothetical protein
VHVVVQRRQRTYGTAHRHNLLVKLGALVGAVKRDLLRNRRSGGNRCCSLWQLGPATIRRRDNIKL